MSETSSNKLAEKIARLLETEARPTEIAALYAAIDKLNHRLDKLEQINPKAAVPATAVLHPSQERYSVAEAIADEIFAGFTKEKACTFEPNAKPCDHCSMCSSRGF
jgi:hypothetical protein